MDCFWLNFHDPVLESRYDHYMVQRFWRFEGLFFCLCIPIILAYIGRTLFDGGDAPLLPSVVNLMNLVFIIYVRNTGGVEMMKKWRTPLFVCSRLVGLAGFSVVHSTLRWRFSTKQPAIMILMQWMQAHHAIGAVLPAIGCRLKFKCHFFVRVVETCIFLVVQTPGTCHNFLQGPEAETLISSEAIVDSYIYKSLCIFYSVIGLPGIPRQKKEPCIHMATVLHIVFSMGLVSYLVWRLERRARIMFLQSLTDRHRQENVELIQQLTTADDIHHFFAIICFSCVWWEASTRLPLAYFMRTYAKTPV